MTAVSPVWPRLGHAMVMCALEGRSAHGTSVGSWPAKRTQTGQGVRHPSKSAERIKIGWRERASLLADDPGVTVQTPGRRIRYRPRARYRVQLAFFFFKQKTAY